MNKYKYKAISLIILIGCLIASPSIFANTISGSVTLSTGDAVDGARVGIVNIDTNARSLMVTGADGLFLFENLVSGTYRVRAQEPALGSIIKETTVVDNVVSVVDFQFEVEPPPPTETDVLKVTDVSIAAGVANETYWGVTDHSLGIAWIDYDNDGLDDIFAVNGFGFSAHLYHNNGDGTFTLVDDLLPTPNFGEFIEMSGARFGDYDNDGDSDIFIANDNEDFKLFDFNLPDGPENMLLKNMWVENGNQVIAGQPLFVDVSVQAGIQDLANPPLGTYLAKRTKTMGLLDYDQDGCLDLFWGQMVLQASGSIENKNTLYRNNCDGTGTFTNVTDIVGLGPSSDYYRPTLAFQGVHLDSDNHPDMYVCNVHEESPFHHDVIYQNNGNGTFTDITGLSPGVGDDAGSCMAVDVADIDLNGTWDIYMSDVFDTVNDALPFGNPLYLGNGDGTFQDNSAVEAGIEAGFSWGVIFADLDTDGYEDLFVAGKGGGTTFLFKNNRNGTFEDVTESSGLKDYLLGDLRGVAMSDYDNDGDLDLALIRDRNQIHILRNDTVTDRHWIKLKLVGVQSNKDAIGAIVKLNTTNGKNLMRQVKGGVGTHSQSSLDVHFGMGGVGVNQITIEWPSGTVDVLTRFDAPLNSRVTVTEGAFSN